MPSRYLQKRISSGNKIDVLAAQSILPFQFPQGIDRVGTLWRFEFCCGRHKAWMAGGRQTHHGISVREGDETLRGLVGRLGGHDEKYTDKSKKLPAALRNLEVPQMYGIKTPP